MNNPNSVFVACAHPLQLALFSYTKKELFMHSCL